MAGRGRAPKPADQRRRRNKVAPPNLVSDDHAVHGPSLPDVFEDESWHPRTVAWWETWRRSAQAKTFTATDWSFLADTAALHHRMWSTHNFRFAAELRLRVSKFGATPEDRARLNLEVVQPDSVPRRGKAASRRERLLQVVADPDA